ncbi:signal recognition particle-docking protein FtsY [Halothiobacillus neapolitanus]|uniref:Signal recognition particle receptor FtsY n=1 Tax=Halothiobacillus neapolitanus (strain ATCC 23641 / DSM 15147 / CIP 104769 / NCIMB 8539 / c2) TaxID=555778 RepID=D0L101_HALNC|nr:signal recognition particle-docking protein FtsY [Halothiobacillus neapolitanus]ACX96374.1 signal recognition particle-docking protein FtsY [Halothiobacillus neapolitanus c2]TDN66689.1 signal recognition particle-docking protein FtsY [Halothiobacillus neapolitanus]
MFGFLRRKKNQVPGDAAIESPVDSSVDAPEVDTLGTDTSPITEPVEAPSTIEPEPLPAVITAEPEPAQTSTQIAIQSAPQPVTQEKPKSRFWQQLARARNNFTEGLGDLFLGKKAIDDELLEEVETRLIMADVGQATTRALIDALHQQISRKQINDTEALFETLSQLMIERLERVQKPRPAPTEQPHIIVVCGINGAGKTTTIGKLAHHYKQSGHKVMLAAGDTFRAAAVEQLITWGERNQIPVIGEPGRQDSASVLFDAAQSARARNMDVLIADTAGRLHTQGGLMDELKKLIRVVSKSIPGAPHEILLVLDASIGQNALNQARQFHEAVGVTGLIVTKLDGTAKGGILFAIADELKLPIDFIGVGEQIADLRPFDPKGYVDALLDREDI